MQREQISEDAGQSFRFFSWEGKIEQVSVQQSDRTTVEVSGMGNQWHFHPEIELTMITEGEGLRFVGDHISSFTAPDFVLLGSNLPHYWKTESTSGFCVQFAFGPEAPLANLRESAFLTSLVKLANRGLLFSAQTSRKMVGLMESSVTASAIVRLSNVLQILQHLRKAKHEALSKIQPVSMERQSVVIQRAVTYIIDHAGDETLQLQEVLDSVKMSRATFSRHFQTSLGQSFTQFLQKVRLEIAWRFLTTTDRSIAEIAFESGFGNLAHFNSLFRQRWSMTPTMMRGKLRSR